MKCDRCLKEYDGSRCPFCEGIPVVTVDESGDMVQIAEIECSEWTLSKSLTDEIEAL